MKSIQVRIREIGWDGKDVEEYEEYAVNKYGEGLFRRGRDGSWKQVTGTGQFSAKTPKELMRKLRSQYYPQDGLETIRMVRGSAVGWIDP